MNSTASAILELAADMGRTHPKDGWDEVNRLTGFHVTIMAMTGNAGGNLVDCLASVGLDRGEVVDAFVLAKPRVMAKGKAAAQAVAVAAPKSAPHVQAETAPPSAAPQAALNAPKMASKGLVQPAKATPPAPKPAAAPARPAARVKTDTQPTLF